MKKWQKTVLEHHENAEILTPNTICVPDAGYDENGDWFYDLIAETENGYTVSSILQDTKEVLFTENYESITDYLGY